MDQGPRRRPALAPRHRHRPELGLGHRSGRAALHDSVVVFDKKHRFRPFNEVVGSSSYLFAERFTEGIGNELLATRDAALRERDVLQAKLARVTEGESRRRSALRWTSRSRLRLARTEMGKARKQLAELGRASDDRAGTGTHPQRTCWRAGNRSRRCAETSVAAHRPAAGRPGVRGR